MNYQTASKIDVSPCITRKVLFESPCVFRKMQRTQSSAEMHACITIKEVIRCQAILSNSYTCKCYTKLNNNGCKHIINQ